MPDRAWGCEHLSEIDCVVKVLDAGWDQFGGESRPDLILTTVSEGLLTEERINESVRKLIAEKFEIGLLENPYFDVELVADIVGNPSFVSAGLDVQRRSTTLLKNQNDFILPLSIPSASSNLKFYVEGIPHSDLLALTLQTTTTPSEANVAFIRLKAPNPPVPVDSKATSSPETSSSPIPSSPIFPPSPQSSQAVY